MEASLILSKLLGSIWLKPLSPLFHCVKFVFLLLILLELALPTELLLTKVPSFEALLTKLTSTSHISSSLIEHPPSIVLIPSISMMHITIVLLLE
jgi:hypothetical protein